MNPITIIILIALGIICAVVHKNKGYSPIAGFLWGFFFSIIGLIVVLLEKDKEEKEMSGNQGLKMWQWLLIFLGIGIFLIFIGIKVSFPMTISKKASDVIDSVDFNSSVISAFNSKFTAYEGEEQKGSTIKSLIMMVNNSNTIDDENKVSIKFNNVQYSSENISSLSNLVKATNKYSVKLEYNKSTKLVDTIIINEN